MRAVWLKQFGPPDVLVPGEASDPIAAGGQVVVAVEFPNITFIETQIRAGRSPFPLPADALPMILGNGVGGVVAALGPDVDSRLLGRRVITGTGGAGGYAERVAVAASGLIEVQDDLLLDQAVALLADGRTSRALIRTARVLRGDRVLVEAAAGGVGSLLVQMAHAAGATVVAVAGGPGKLRLARDLGADITIDYRNSNWADHVLDQLGGVDVVFDGVGGEIGRAAFGLLDNGGRMLSYGLSSGGFTQVADGEAQARGVELLRGVRVSPAEALDLTRFALAEAAAGRLRPVIGQRFALEDAAAAHAVIESRDTIGKTLLEVA